MSLLPPQMCTPLPTYYTPEYYCRDTNTSEREICTYVYEKEEVIAPRTTTQVTYDQKPETMKVTTCGAA